MDEPSSWVGGCRGSPLESGAIGHGSCSPWSPSGVEYSTWDIHSLVGFDLTFLSFRSE